MSGIGVVFDLDGVLVMSEHLWEKAWLDYAAPLWLRLVARRHPPLPGHERDGVGHVPGRPDDA